MTMAAADDDDDDMPVLSDFAMAALQDFYREQQELDVEQKQKGGAVMPQEDWQLSQFWYTEDSTLKLAEEALAVIGATGKVACMCCPSIHKKLVELDRGDQSKVLEIDRRFGEKFGDQYIYYDYNEPLALDADLENTFDLVIVDPPFLNKDCLSQSSRTVKFLAKGKIIVCTGERMKDGVKELLNCEPIEFIPRHHQLANEFRCYTNYDVITLKDANKPK